MSWMHTSCLKYSYFQLGSFFSNVFVWQAPEKKEHMEKNVAIDPNVGCFFSIWVSIFHRPATGKQNEREKKEYEKKRKKLPNWTNAIIKQRMELWPEWITTTPVGGEHLVKWTTIKLSE